MYIKVTVPDEEIRKGQAEYTSNDMPYGMYSYKQPSANFTITKSNDNGDTIDKKTVKLGPEMRNFLLNELPNDMQAASDRGEDTKITAKVIPEEKEIFTKSKAEAEKEAREINAATRDFDKANSYGANDKNYIIKMGNKRTPSSSIYIGKNYSSYRNVDDYISSNLNDALIDRFSKLSFNNGTSLNKDEISQMLNDTISDADKRSLIAYNKRSNTYTYNDKAGSNVLGRLKNKFNINPAAMSDILRNTIEGLKDDYEKYMGDKEANIQRVIIGNDALYPGMLYTINGEPLNPLKIHLTASGEPAYIDAEAIRMHGGREMKTPSVLYKQAVLQNILTNGVPDFNPLFAMKMPYFNPEHPDWVTDNFIKINSNGRIYNIPVIPRISTPDLNFVSDLYDFKKSGLTPQQAWDFMSSLANEYGSPFIATQLGAATKYNNAYGKPMNKPISYVANMLKAFASGNRFNGITLSDRALEGYPSEIRDELYNILALEPFTRRDKPLVVPNGTHILLGDEIVPANRENESLVYTDDGRVYRKDDAYMRNPENPSEFLLTEQGKKNRLPDNEIPKYDIGLQVADPMPRGELKKYLKELAKVAHSYTGNNTQETADKLEQLFRERPFWSKYIENRIGSDKMDDYSARMMANINGLRLFDLPEYSGRGRRKKARSLDEVTEKEWDDFVDKFLIKHKIGYIKDANTGNLTEKFIEFMPTDKTKEIIQWDYPRRDAMLQSMKDKGGVLYKLLGYAKSLAKQSQTKDIAEKQLKNVLSSQEQENWNNKKGNYLYDEDGNLVFFDSNTNKAERNNPTTELREYEKVHPSVRNAMKNRIHFIKQNADQLYNSLLETDPELAEKIGEGGKYNKLLSKDNKDLLHFVLDSINKGVEYYNLQKEPLIPNVAYRMLKRYTDAKDAADEAYRIEQAKAKKRAEELAELNKKYNFNINTDNSTNSTNSADEARWAAIRAAEEEEYRQKYHDFVKSRLTTYIKMLQDRADSADSKWLSNAKFEQSKKQADIEGGYGQRLPFKTDEKRASIEKRDFTARNLIDMLGKLASEGVEKVDGYDLFSKRVDNIIDKAVSDKYVGTEDEDVKKLYSAVYKAINGRTPEEVAEEAYNNKINAYYNYQDKQKEKQNAARKKYEEQSAKEAEQKKAEKDAEFSSRFARMLRMAANRGIANNLGINTINGLIERAKRGETFDSDDVNIQDAYSRLTEGLFGDADRDKVEKDKAITEKINKLIGVAYKQGLLDKVHIPNDVYEQLNNHAKNKDVFLDSSSVGVQEVYKKLKQLLSGSDVTIEEE